jgi:hypothetical protein
MCAVPAVFIAAAWSGSPPLAAFALHRVPASIRFITTYLFSGLPEQKFRDILAWTKKVWKCLLIRATLYSTNYWPFLLCLSVKRCMYEYIKLTVHDEYWAVVGCILQPCKSWFRLEGMGWKTSKLNEIFFKQCYLFGNDFCIDFAIFETDFDTFLLIWTCWFDRLNCVNIVAHWKLLAQRQEILYFKSDVLTAMLSRL